MNCALCQDKECFSGKDCTSIKSKSIDYYENSYNKKVIFYGITIAAIAHFMKLARFCPESF